MKRFLAILILLVATSPALALTTVYIDLNIGTATGTGTDLDPYGTLAYALAQEDTTADDVVYKLRHTGATKEFNLTTTHNIATTSNTAVTIEPDTGYGWSGGLPQITLYTTGANTIPIDFNQSGTLIIRDLIVQHRRNGSGEKEAIQVSSSCDEGSVFIERMVLVSNSKGVGNEMGGSKYVTVRNSFITHYSDNEGGIAGITASGNGRIKSFNNTFVLDGGNGLVMGTSGDGTENEAKNNIFIDVGTEVNLDIGTRASNNATDEATATANMGANSVANVATSDFESVSSFDNPWTAGADFRLASGNTNLKDAGTDPSGFSDDAFGTTRPQGSDWDIGYHELEVSSGTTIPNTLQNLAKTVGPQKSQTLGGFIEQ